MRSKSDYFDTNQLKPETTFLISLQLQECNHSSTKKDGRRRISLVSGASMQNGQDNRKKSVSA